MKLIGKATAQWLIALVCELTMACKSPAKIVITFAHTSHLKLMDIPDQERLQRQNQREQWNKKKTKKCVPQEFNFSFVKD